MKNLTHSHSILRSLTGHLAPVSFSHVAMTLGVVTAVACGGSVDAGVGKNGVNSVDAGGADGGGAADSGIDPVQACDDYVTKVVRPCGLAGAFPASDTAYVLDRYRTSCTARLALPGTGFTPSFLAACVSAVASTGCSDTNRLACTVLAGTLPGGAPCAMAEQCESGICDNSGQGTCGTCAAPEPAGQQCWSATSPDRPCPSGEVCDVRLSPTGGVIGGTLHCVPRADKVGASCVPTPLGETRAPLGYNIIGCTDGLYCDDASQTCKAVKVVGAGQECTAPNYPIVPPVVCAAGLVCSGDGTPIDANGPPNTLPVQTCKDPGVEGAPCGGNQPGCASGLGCVDAQGGSCCTEDGCVADCTCGVRTFAGPGEVCDSQVNCRVGSCPGDGARCPTVIPDGQPCNAYPNPNPGPANAGPANPGPGPNETCDLFSSCIDGKCTPGGYPTCP